MTEHLPMVNLHGTGYVGRGAAGLDHTFLRAMSFHEPEGLAAVLDDSGAYHIDVSGRPCYPQRYLETFGFYGGAATVRDEAGYFHIDAQGRPLHDRRYLWAGNFQEELCPARDATGFLHVNLAGRPAYDERYAYVGDFVHGVAVVYEDRGSFHIRRDGSRLHQQTFLATGVFHKGFATAEDERGVFHVDLAGNAIHPHRFSLAEPFYNGVALCRRKDGRFVRLRENGHFKHLPAANRRIGPDQVRVQVEAGARVGILLRHAERHPIVSGWGNQALLTEVGIAQAKSLGERLAGLPTLKVYSSPIERCIQTGHAFSVGAGRPQDPTTTRLLGDPGPFADPARSHEIQLEPREFCDFATRYLEVGRAPGMHPLETACDALRDGMRRRLSPGLTIFVSHDLFAAGLLSFLGLKRPSREDWADYLEGACISAWPNGDIEWHHFFGLEAN